MVPDALKPFVKQEETIQFLLDPILKSFDQTIFFDMNNKYEILQKTIKQQFYLGGRKYTAMEIVDVFRKFDIAINAIVNNYNLGVMGLPVGSFREGAVSVQTLEYKNFEELLNYIVGEDKFHVVYTIDHESEKEEWTLRIAELSKTGF